MPWIRKTLLFFAFVAATPSYAQETPKEWTVTVEDCVILNDGLNAWTEKVLLDWKSASDALEQIRKLETAIRVISRPGERTPERVAEDEKFLEIIEAVKEALGPVLQGPDAAAQSANEAFRRMCPKEYLPPRD